MSSGPARRCFRERWRTAVGLTARMFDIGRCPMRLRTKFLIFVGLVVVVSYGITFYRTSSFQQQLVITQAALQARMLHKQILLTRKWVADHNGIFLLKQPGVEANPYLVDPEVLDAAGRRYVKRNPAMVTRELSEYAAREGLWRYRVTSLSPTNPANRPDDFERRSLQRFSSQGKETEAIEIQKNSDGRVLRYMAPLVVESSCLECHAGQGFAVGDILGGLSITIPVDWAFAGIGSNNRMLLGIAIITILVVGGAIFLLLDSLVVRRLALLARAMERYPQEAGADGLPAGPDEVGELANKFRELCARLTASQQELDQARAQVFQNEKLAALGRLTAGIAHEINNPLGGMLNCVKGMREDPDDREMAGRYLDLLDKGLTRIGQTVRQLLNFGRRDPLQLKPVQIDELIRECCALLAHSHNNIEFNLDLHLREAYPVDLEALKQVIVNIGLNAIQAMAQGGTLTVRSAAADAGVVLSFADTGSGIDPDHMAKIFEPFFTTKEVGQGTGLGLSISHSLVQRMGGTISVESEPGRGTIFRIELPMTAI